VRLSLQNGRVLERFQPTRKGDPDAPLSDADLSAKFEELVAPVLGAGPASALLEALWHGDAVPGALPT
jgi:hypothetical protein